MIRMMLLLTLITMAGLPTPGRAQAPAAPAASESIEYTLAPGDRIRVSVFGEDSLSGEYVISSSGNLLFPLIGNLPATDKTVEALQASVTAALADGYLREPRVTIQVVAFRPFYILGEVARPGDYPVSTGLTIEQAVSQAGGYTYRANTRKIYIKRANETSERLIDLRKASPPIVRAGDTIRVAERHF